MYQIQELSLFGQRANLYTHTYICTYIHRCIGYKNVLYSNKGWICTYIDVSDTRTFSLRRTFGKETFGKESWWRWVRAERVSMSLGRRQQQKNLKNDLVKRKPNWFCKLFTFFFLFRPLFYSCPCASISMSLCLSFMTLFLSLMT
jgi:hypothetical protein